MVWPFSRDKGPSDARLGVMLSELRTMRDKLEPNQAHIAKEKAYEKMDRFDKGRTDMDEELIVVEKNLQELESLREKHKSRENADRDMLRLCNGIRTSLGKSLADITALGKEAEKAVKKAKKKNKATAQDLFAVRVEYLNLTKERIEGLRARNSTHVAIMVNESKVANVIAERGQIKAEERKQRLDEIQKKRGKGGNFDFGSIGADEGGAQGDQPLEVQQWYAQVEANKQEQEALLLEVDKGLDVLLNLANDLKREIDIVGVAIDEVDETMDETQTELNQANDRLDKLLEQSGGLARWCPIMICCVVLLALVAYLINLGRGRA